MKMEIVQLLRHFPLQFVSIVRNAILVQLVCGFGAGHWPPCMGPPLLHSHRVSCSSAVENNESMSTCILG